MQTRSFRGSGEPAWVNASPNACFGLGPDPRRALGPAAIRAASTGRTHDRTRPVLHHVKKALVNQAPSTHDRPFPRVRYTTKLFVLQPRYSCVVTCRCKWQNGRDCEPGRYHVKSRDGE